MDNVQEIPVGKAKERKPTKAEVHSTIADIVSGLPLARMFPEFGKKFYVWSPDRKSRVLLAESAPGTVKTVDDAYLASEILRYCRDQLAQISTSYDLTYNSAVEAARYFVSSASLLERDPKSIAFNSDPRIAFHRLPFDPIATETLDDTPVWKEIGERMANFEAFCLRFASIFDQHADRKQALFVYGEKDTGKSQVQYALASLGGVESPDGAVATLGRDELKSQFWKASIADKRILLLSEFSTKFLNSEFKSLTGDSFHAINQKNRPIYQRKLDVLCFIFSNEPPHVAGDPAIRERIVPCCLSELPPGVTLEAEHVYRRKLLDELPMFIGFCMNAYEGMQGKRIPCDFTLLDQQAERDDSDAIDFFEAYFVADEEASVCCELVFQHALHVRRIRSHEYNRWVRIWERRYGIRRQREGSGQRRNMFRGMRFRQNFNADVMGVRTTNPFMENLDHVPY